MNGLSVILAAKLFCTAPLVLNKTDFPINKRDRIATAQAVIDCRTKFENSPCLKCFFKSGERNWLAVCEPKTKKGVIVDNKKECKRIWKGIEEERRKLKRLPGNGGEIRRW